MQRGLDIFGPFAVRPSASRQETSMDPDPKGTKLKHDLTETLDAIETFGEFAAKKTYSQFANPGIQIGDALIALPLDPNQVPLIREASRQAPFGRGDKTLVDTSVRDTWELDPSKFQIANSAAWNAFVTTVLRRDVSQSLGMSDVKAELYKLLLYEKGSFFKRHKDSEKAPGMIATLSICLPSKYEGGEVHLSHAGKNRVFDTAGQSMFDVSALAWYADVTHEIKPITEGQRLVLIYNIIRARSGPTSAGYLTEQQEKLCSALANLSQRSSGRPPSRLLYLFEHKYSQTSLRIDQLKGRDRAVGYALQEACARNGYYLFLCNLTKKAGEDGYGYDYGYDDDEDDDDYGGDCDGPPLAMDTVATCNGETFAMDVELDKKDILGDDPYRGRDADSESEGEDTGNEGAIMEYRYHDSAALIVPKGELEQFFEFDAKMGVLMDLVMSDLDAHPEDFATREATTEFLSRAVFEDCTLSPRVLKIAKAMKNADLSNAAIRAGFRDGVPKEEVIEALVNIVKNAPPGAINWDESFRMFVAEHLSLRQLSVSLDTIEGMLYPGDMRTSFQRWRSTMELLEFERRQLFGPDDHDAIIGLMVTQRDNADWVRNTLIPKVRDGGGKILLSKFICSLLEKGREGVLDGAAEIANLVLESSVQKLHLARIKFHVSLPRNTTVAWNDTFDCKELERFCQLVDNCLSSGLEQHANELLRLSIGVVKAAPKDDGPSAYQLKPPADSKTLAQEMLQSICGSFEKSGISPGESARDFVTTVLKKYVIRDLPKCPKPLPGHSHRPRGCQKCKHCLELDAFLRSQTQEETEFLKGPKISLHMESHLPSTIFRCTMTEVMTNHKAQQFALNVRKLGTEHQVALNEYMNDLRQIKLRLQPFQTEYMNAFLGESAYGDLVLLRQAPHAGEIELGRRGSARAGHKRQAQGSIELPAAKR